MTNFQVILGIYVYASTRIPSSFAIARVQALSTSYNPVNYMCANPYVSPVPQTPAVNSEFVKLVNIRLY